MKKLNTKLLQEVKFLKENNEKELLEVRKEKTELLELKNEIKLQIIELENRKKEYDEISQIKNFLLEVGSEDSLSYYTYMFNSIQNIIGIKLEKYSVPFINYNIETDINNIFEIEIENENKQIILESGKYNITNLIKALNNNTLNLIFELDEITQKIQVSSNTNTNFNIIPNVLSISVLGFISSYINNYLYKADKCYDLRRDDKIYLYLNNIDNSSPFAILNYEGIANAEIKFENEIVLDKLDIVFKNSKGNLYNFHGLNHNLTFNLTSL